MEELNKYYYQVKDSWCHEFCNYRDDGTKIGSIKCQKCDHCKASNYKENWIKCDIITIATNNPLA